MYVYGKGNGRSFENAVFPDEGSDEFRMDIRETTNWQEQRVKHTVRHDVPWYISVLFSKYRHFVYLYKLKLYLQFFKSISVKLL